MHLSVLTLTVFFVGGTRGVYSVHMKSICIGEHVYDEMNCDLEVLFFGNVKWCQITGVQSKGGYQIKHKIIVLS